MWLFSYICACTLKCIQVTRLVDLIPLYNSKKSLRYCTRYNTYYRKACLLTTTLTSSYVLNYFRSWNSGSGYMSYVIFLIIGPILFSWNSFLWNVIVTLFLFTNLGFLPLLFTLRNLSVIIFFELKHKLDIFIKRHNFWWAIHLWN